jgi:predicted DNA-binding antitoxin AbrB/MazE fold protein
MDAIMTQVISATFENGVFKPDQQPNLAEQTKVRLLVETVESGAELSKKAWADLQQIWRTSKFNSHGDRLTRDQLHERR